MSKDNNKPVFTIITVSKDNLDGLKATYKSIGSQSVTDFEWIVIDGASSDGTPKFLETTDAKWISEEDHGIYDAMNKAIPLANGQYTLFLNAGDKFAQSDTLAKIRIPQGKLPDLIYGDALEQRPCHPDKPVFKPARSHKRIHRRLFTHHQAIFYKTEHLQTMKYNTLYKIAADYDLTVRFLKEWPDAHYITLPICVFEAGGISQREEKRGRTEQQIIRKKLLGYNWFENKRIALLQRIASWIKRQMPPVYWWVRSH